MTKQDYYNLLVQCAQDGTFPSHQDGTCRYRGPHETRCAFGILIPDEEYEEEMEGQDLTLLDREFVDYLTPEGIPFRELLKIQKIHDGLSEIFSSEQFIRSINALPCFDDVQKENVPCA
jgi:hypothetical protein